MRAEAEQEEQEENTETEQGDQACDSEAAEDEGAFLLPKLHMERCVMDLNCLHISKSAYKKSKLFDITVDKCFREVRTVVKCSAASSLPACR